MEKGKIGIDALYDFLRTQSESITAYLVSKDAFELLGKDDNDVRNAGRNMFNYIQDAIIAATDNQEAVKCGTLKLNAAKGKFSQSYEELKKVLITDDDVSRQMKITLGENVLRVENYIKSL